VFSVGDDAVTLRAEAGADARGSTVAVARVLDALRAEGSVPMLGGWRDEQFAIRPSFFTPALPVRLSGVRRVRGGVRGRRAVGRAVARVGGSALPLQAERARRPPGRRGGRRPRRLSGALAGKIRTSGGVCYTGFDETRWRGVHEFTSYL
jgi:hypothetical protein